MVILSSCRECKHAIIRRNSLCLLYKCKTQVTNTWNWCLAHCEWDKMAAVLQKTFSNPLLLTVIKKYQTVSRLFPSVQILTMKNVNINAHYLTIDILSQAQTSHDDVKRYLNTLIPGLRWRINTVNNSIICQYCVYPSIYDTWAIGKYVYIFDISWCTICIVMYVMSNFPFTDMSKK